MKIYSIDRFEENFAICEDDNCSVTKVKINDLPENAKPGDMIVVDDAGNIKVDEELTKARKEKILEMQNKLFK